MTFTRRSFFCRAAAGALTALAAVYVPGLRDGPCPHPDCRCAYCAARARAAELWVQEWETANGIDDDGFEF